MSSERPNLISRINNGEFPVIVQLHPPKLEKRNAFFETVDRLEKECGITLFDVNASPDPERMESFDVAAKIAKGTRIIMPHVTAREPLETTLQQANTIYETHHINHLLVVKGDPPKKGDYQTDVQTIMISLSALTTPDGKKKFIITGGASHNAENLKKEAARLDKTAEQGADIFMSQLILDKDQARKLYKLSKKPLIAGISALKKIGNIPGVVVPEKIEEPTKIVAYIKDKQLAQGIYIAAPITLTNDFIPVIQKILSAT